MMKAVTQRVEHRRKGTQKEGEKGRENEREKERKLNDNDNNSAK
jgi:hypothetical protein